MKILNSETCIKKRLKMRNSRRQRNCGNSGMLIIQILLNFEAAKKLQHGRKQEIKA
jgi:hypothetical protein